jgi:hypothetical protein
MGIVLPRPVIAAESIEKNAQRMTAIMHELVTYGEQGI